ncbi:MAG: hypothetical protein A3H35_21645 [Betaproteobacteria bacterium RIFCSPLOWO2_02_FULL_62_17]|nr:MAG: hypothetical protein A3H35_21645 [Betaproteobacteria bacterium RIFCSPLOWO2_02_FULL_62_17]
MLRLRRPATLFGKTAVTIALSLIVMQLLALGVAFFTILLPLARRSADDLAALIVLSAQTWAELPPDARRDFRDELANSHGLWLVETDAPLPDGGQHLPYLQMLEQALEKRSGRPIRIKVTVQEERWFWAEISAGGQSIRIGFSQQRIGANPLLAIAMVLGIGTLLALLTTLLLVRRLTLPLDRLTQAAARVGRGETPELLPEAGPVELATLARVFNRMTRQVRELLDNRTTLLAGISHDLRTPLARLRLALEMLAEKPSPALISRMGRDLEEMNRMIGEFLELARGLQQEEKQSVDIGDLIGKAVDDARAGGAVIHWAPAVPCRRDCRPRALRRIVDNLIQNAVRHGGAKPVTVEYDCNEGGIGIRVLDRGPGIAPDQMEAVFRPFYRVESSRSGATGGSGLGLAIARQLSEANGWQIKLLGREGGGTEARLSL